MHSKTDKYVLNLSQKLVIEKIKKRSKSKSIIFKSAHLSCYVLDFVCFALCYMRIVMKLMQEMILKPGYLLILEQITGMSLEFSLSFFSFISFLFLLFRFLSSNSLKSSRM